MSAQQRRFTTSLRAGHYAEWIFGAADHLPIDDPELGEYLIHTQDPRFMARIEPNEAACDTLMNVDDQLVAAQYGLGTDAFVEVTWGDESDLSVIEYRHIINLDDTALDWNKVSDALLGASRLWIEQTIEANQMLEE